MPETKEKIKTYLVDALLFTNDGNKEKRPDFTKYGKPYWKLSVKYVQYLVTVPREFPPTLIKQRITDTEEDKNEWKQIISIMYTDAEFSKYYDLRVSYINAVYIGTVERIKNRRSSYNPLDENLRDATNRAYIIDILKLTYI